MNKIESYIDSVIPKNIPKTKQQKLKSEIESHIYDRIDFYTDIGYDTDSSINKALADMGEDEETKTSIRNDFEELHFEHTHWALIASAIIFIISMLPFIVICFATDASNGVLVALSFLSIFCVAAEIWYCYKKGLQKCLIGIGISNLLILPTVLIIAYPFFGCDAFGDVVTYILDAYTNISVKDFLSGCTGFEEHSSTFIIVIFAVISFVLSDKIRKYGKRHKNNWGVILSAIVYLVVSIFVLSFCNTAAEYFNIHPERSCDYVTATTVDYEQDEDDYKEFLRYNNGEYSFFPSVEEAENNHSFKYRRYKDYSLFGGSGYLVSQKLTEEEFDAKVNSLKENHSFLTEPVICSDGSGDYKIPEEKFEIFDYTFMVLCDETDYYGEVVYPDYPKSFGMIAVSDEENKIVYFAFESIDLDIITDMIDFVEENFPGWENV